jgi:protein O-GlcNAc transferase
MLEEELQAAERLLAAGRAGEAATKLRQILIVRPRLPAAWWSLGAALRAGGDLNGAIDSFRKAIAQKPDFFEAYNDLGVSLAMQRRLNEAAEVFAHAVRLSPNRAEGRNNLANALVELRKWDEAIPHLRRTLELRPDLPQAHANLGNAMRGKGRPEEAIALFREALRLNPQLIDAKINLVALLREMCELKEAAELERQVLAAAPRDFIQQSNRLYNLYYDPDCDAATIYREHVKWNELLARPLRPTEVDFQNDRSEHRRLRIGYVSADFCRHVMALSMWPLLSNHRHDEIELYCYSSVLAADENTERFRGCADHWRQCAGQSDGQVAEQIRSDRIDILVDLSMHMSGGRPMLFAQKPAPVQVAAMAYPGTTGQSAIDFRITDPYLDPPGQGDENYSERSIRLPETFWCYDPLSDKPEVNALPALTSGFVTFGCLNSFRKVTPRTLALWAMVLSEVRDSRMILLCPPGAHRAGVIEKLGVDAARVEFVEYQARDRYLETYHRIDIGLDTLPYNGHTTSLDSYWMGVPVVTRVGETVVGRAGLSQLNNLGLTELAARSDEEFVKIASGLASDLPRLAQLRATLRERMEKSPLMDGSRFARNMESAYRQMWVNWCRKVSQ